MSRLLSSIRKDMIVQARKQFYSISIGVAALFAVIFSLVLDPKHVVTAAPAAMLLVVGGTTLIFVGGLILDEKEKGILKALLLSPLTTGEYLWSKILSLTLLATVEVGIMIGGPLIYFNQHDGVALPNLLLLAAGVVTLNLQYTLLGIALTVRFKKITDYMLPVAAFMVVLQVPILFFAGIVSHPSLLIVPSAAPVMLVRGAFEELSTIQWLYATGYSLGLLAVLAWWAQDSYQRYVVRRMS